MFIHCKKSVRIREGGESVTIPKDFVGDVPDWAAKSWYFQALVKDGTIQRSEPEKAVQPEPEPNVEKPKGKGS